MIGEHLEEAAPQPTNELQNHTRLMLVSMHDMRFTLGEISSDGGKLALALPFEKEFHLHDVRWWMKGWWGGTAE